MPRPPHERFGPRSPPQPPHEMGYRCPEYEPTHGEIMEKVEEILAEIREIKKRVGR